MNRGIFSFIKDNNYYKKSYKNWLVNLDQYHKYWYDLIVNPYDFSDYFDSKKAIREKLKEIESNLMNNINKRFIYFICSRKRVRFNLNKRIKYNIFNKKIYIPILIGGSNINKTLKLNFLNPEMEKIKPEIQLTDKYITIIYNEYKETYSIHDFLDLHNISLGFYNKVEYVGYTENPSSRPTNSSHAGLSDILYKVPNDDNDIFIYFNTFTVRTKSCDDLPLVFLVSNSMIDEIDINMEGKIIEKCFIFYFDSDNQTRNKESEYSELKNNLNNLMENNNINSITIHYELEHPNEYSIFYSSKVMPKLSHRFSVNSNNDGLKVQNV